MAMSGLVGLDTKAKADIENMWDQEGMVIISTP